MRRDQAHLMSESHQLLRPVMRRGAGLHANQASRELAEEAQQLRSSHLPRQDDCTGCVNPMHVEDTLGQIQSDLVVLLMSGLLLVEFTGP
jgi:hypothetical protein